MRYARMSATPPPTSSRPATRASVTGSFGIPKQAEVIDREGRAALAEDDQRDRNGGADPREDEGERQDDDEAADAAEVEAPRRAGGEEASVRAAREVEGERPEQHDRRVHHQRRAEADSRRQPRVRRALERRRDAGDRRDEPEEDARHSASSLDAGNAP